MTQGAFGEVWKGRWAGRHVAVKCLKEAVMESDLESEAEFASEVELLRRLRCVSMARARACGLWVTCASGVEG